MHEKIKNFSQKHSLALFYLSLALVVIIVIFGVWHLFDRPRHNFGDGRQIMERQVSGQNRNFGDRQSNNRLDQTGRNQNDNSGFRSSRQTVGQGNVSQQNSNVPAASKTAPATGSSQTVTQPQPTSSN